MLDRVVDILGMLFPSTFGDARARAYTGAWPARHPLGSLRRCSAGSFIVLKNDNCTPREAFRRSSYSTPSDAETERYLGACVT